MASSTECAEHPLPPGQRLHPDFPRFGLTPYARRFPAEPRRILLDIATASHRVTLTDELLQQLPRVSQISDFHCVTTWSRQALHWSGWRFRDLHTCLREMIGAELDALQFVVLRAQDGYRTTLPLADLLAEDVLLADRLDGAPLSIAHGAPLRLVAPAHYGYKSVKHLSRIEFWLDHQNHRPLVPRLLRFMVHPRGRVLQEERGQWIPGWLLRRLYRPLIAPTARRFAQAMQAHERGQR